MRRKNKISLVSIALFIALLVGAVSYINHQLSPVNTDADGTIEVTIESGDSTMVIAEKLAAAGAIRNAKLFYYYTRVTGNSSNFRAGTFEVPLSATRSELIQLLTGRSGAIFKTIKFTIPEGYTAKQIAARLATKGFVNEQEFLALLQQPNQFQGEAVKSATTDSKQLIALEGYLFPETYILPADSTEQEIAQEMVTQMDVKLAKLPAGWDNQLAKLDLTFHELLTVASLIEREVVVEEERAIVASVIYNRLKVGQPLQIDATVQYLLSKQKERLLYADLEVDSPYNTYKIKGLPPGPIANPSLASIEAALYPATTNYYYYVTKKDGTSAHLFAMTYAEHLKNIAKSKQ